MQNGVEGNGVRAEGVSQKKLYSINQQVLATFLGGPLGGAFLLSQNYAQLEALKEARLAVLLGLSATIALFPVAMVLPERFPRPVLPLVYTIAFRELAKYLQGDHLKALAEGQAERRSWWVTTALTLAALAATTALFLGFVFLLSIFS